MGFECPVRLVFVRPAGGDRQARVLTRAEDRAWSSRTGRGAASARRFSLARARLRARGLNGRLDEAQGVCR
ncbi:MAG: hypothetical protein PHG71_08020, partial [Kiritimatiellae bacterium]|nr:hypothetical protein [Kiritimatiellia bacterium]